MNHLEVDLLYRGLPPDLTQSSSAPRSPRGGTHRVADRGPPRLHHQSAPPAPGVASGLIGVELQLLGTPLSEAGRRRRRRAAIDGEARREGRFRSARVKFEES